MFFEIKRIINWKDSLIIWTACFHSLGLWPKYQTAVFVLAVDKILYQSLRAWKDQRLYKLQHSTSPQRLMLGLSTSPWIWSTANRPSCCMSAPEENEIYFYLKMANNKRLSYRDLPYAFLSRKFKGEAEYWNYRLNLSFHNLDFRICDLPNPVLRLKVLPVLRSKALPVLRRTLPVLRITRDSSWKVIASRMKAMKKMPAKFIVDQWIV